MKHDLFCFFTAPETIHVDVAVVHLEFGHLSDAMSTFLIKLHKIGNVTCGLVINKTMRPVPKV